MKVVAAAALALTLATACSDSNDLPTDPTPTGSAATSTSATATTSPISAAAQLEAAARSFYEEATRAAASGEVDSLRSLVEPGCSCQQLVEFIESRWRTGSIKGARFIIERVGPAQIEPRVNVVPVYRRVTAYEVLDRAGRVVEHVAAEPTVREDVYLRFLNGRWLIQNVVLVK